MYIDREEREELKRLSKEVFGKSGAYQKLLNGIPELVTQLKVEEIPGENGNPGTLKETKAPVLLNGNFQFKQRYYTLEEIKTLMLDLKKQQDERKAKIEADKLQMEVQDKAHGSAL